jgi:hypothetical protein
METFLKAAADLVWALAWADHAEEHGCESLSGVNIYDVMPTTPACALEAGKAILAKWEAVNGCTIETLYQRALEADETADAKAGHHGDPMRVRFAECLVYRGLGHGIAWEDDYKTFEYKKAYCDSMECDVRMWADANCEHGESTPSDE